MIKESVEPLLEEYRPPGITSLKFSKLSLGNVAPKVEGINQLLIPSKKKITFGFSSLPIWVHTFFCNPVA